jgi:hypothetical protein
VELSGSLRREINLASVLYLHLHDARFRPIAALTSMEQKIQRIKVWTTTSDADPMPNAK